MFINKNKIIMFDIKKREVKFEWLDYEQKKQKIMNMLEIIKEQWNVFYDLYDILSKENSVSEDTLIEIHNILLDTMYHIDVKNMENSLQELEEQKNNINWIKEKERNESINEDPDKILNNL